MTYAQLDGVRDPGKEQGGAVSSDKPPHGVRAVGEAQEVPHTGGAEPTPQGIPSFRHGHVVEVAGNEGEGPPHDQPLACLIA